jgi:pyruvate/2-oxoglutarate dehydrogenase complex dihydrolipoamide acyltransferase (E2) component
VHHRSDEADERDRADKAGVVKQILAENGQPVEYGQPLVVIVERPSVVVADGGQEPESLFGKI